MAHINMIRERSRRSRRARQLRKALRDTVAMFAACFRDAVRS